MNVGQPIHGSRSRLIRAHDWGIHRNECRAAADVGLDKRQQLVVALGQDDGSDLGPATIHLEHADPVRPALPPSQVDSHDVDPIRKGPMTLLFRRR